MNEIIIYSDGACSKNPGPGGWAAIIQNGNEIKEICGNCANATNNRMELLAIIKALESLKFHCKAVVNTDSKYVVNSINLGWAKKWQENNWVKKDGKKALNQDLFEQLLKLIEFHEIEFNWVKGHCNNKLNERCDFLAVSQCRKLLNK